MFNRFKSKKVIKTPYSAGVTFNANLSALNVDGDRSGMTGLMLETRLPGAEYFIGVRIDGQRENVTDDRQIVVVFL
ncbi:hypothetical protein GCM10008969_58540 [Pseudomonas veronii subsp. inensis]